MSVTVQNKSCEGDCADRQEFRCYRLEVLFDSILVIYVGLQIGKNVCE